ncbi:efflux RND transporter periplasmic adaptor subunit [Piscinibacter sakaiensis]|uniref:efflux RND transporter periplasmic adaptor subunit n=1 Tax=Piscinibacter sakaiensis TaxID=1547922 RepID=UPI003AAFCEF4
MRPLLAVLLSIGMLAGCGKPADAPKAANGRSTAADASLLIAPEDLLTVEASQLANGPVITGSVQPGRRADLRAEVPSVVTAVLKDNGQPVRAGELLMRLDETSLRENLRSAEAAARAAEQALTQAERQLQRLRTLQQQGMATAQALDDAGIRRNNASSDLAAARSRVVAARQQLQKTRIVAPFDGVVSERKASVGDTAQVGKELVKVIDPASMRFEGLVSADRLDELKVGQSVEFRINGFGDGMFDGTVLRIDAAVNPTTRQVAVTVAFDEPAKAPNVAGLFAEGRVAGSGNAVPTVPDNALVRSGEAVSVWRIDGQRLVRQPVRLGERDARSGLYPVRDGLAPGDRILAHPTGSLVDGQAVELAAAAAAVPASAASAAGPAHTR